MRMLSTCPPALAEQWQSELSEKFHVDAERVLPGTAGRLERRCRVGQSLFEVYPHVIVSLDFIKSDRRADDFLRACDLMGVQRHLKVIGIFARICHRDGKPRYLADVPRFFAYIDAVLADRPELCELAELLTSLRQPAEAVI